MSNYSDEQIKMIKNMGALSYPSNVIASIMNLEVEFVEKELKNKDSEFYKHYNAGYTYANYLIDLRLFEMAQSGDIKAIDKFEMRKKLRK